MTILFFDGYCGLCNRVVDLLLDIDKNKQILFAPLQGSTAETHLNPSDRENLESVVLFEDGKIFRKSEAVFRVFTLIGRAWGVLARLRFLPRPFSDLFYDVVANNRYKIFGKKDTCRLPTAEERARFLP